MVVLEYICKDCGRKYDENEFEVTKEKDKCVLHCHNLKELRDNNVLEVKKFWENIEKEISSKNNLNNPEISNEIDEIYGTSDNISHTIDKYIFKNMFFPLTESQIPFYNIKSTKNLYFINCYFFKKLNFRTIFNARKVFFINCKFFDTLDLSNLKIECPFEFKESMSLKDIVLNDTRFKEFVNFENSVFDVITFGNTVFENKTIFRNSIFNNDIDFKYVTFKDVSLFKESVFKKNINLVNTIFEKNPSFLGISSSEKLLRKINVENRETARVIKNSFEQQNNIIEANKFYQLEMEKREEELSSEIKKFRNIFEYIIFKIHGFSSNHSQNALLPLFWIILFTLFYSFYTSVGIVNTRIIEISFFETYMDILMHERLINLESLKTCSIVSIIIAIFIYLISFKWRFINQSILFIYILNVMYYFYGHLTGDWKLFLFSSNLNPFSIMNQNATISFIELLYRITTAYLIYQLIVSIRQNTRRK